MDYINDNLTFNLNHKIRFRLNVLEIIYTKLMLIELMLDYQVEYMLHRYIDSFQIYVHVAKQLLVNVDLDMNR
jgi:hypothetical protein